MRLLEAGAVPVGRGNQRRDHHGDADVLLRQGAGGLQLETQGVDEVRLVDDEIHVRSF